MEASFKIKCQQCGKEQLIPGTYTEDFKINGAPGWLQVMLEQPLIGRNVLFFDKEECYKTHSSRGGYEVLLVQEL